ncbi:hypothetical protein [Streptomyces lydicus]
MTGPEIAVYKCPRSVEFVDAFPLGPSGKVLKRELAATYAPRRTVPSGPR